MVHHSSDSPGVTKELCSWIHSLTIDDIPAAVKTRAKYLILDGICCALVGAHLPWTEKAVDALLAIEPQGNCTIWGHEKVHTLQRILNIYPSQDCILELGQLVL